MIGGAEGIRTPDLRSAIAALSQLSYGPRRRHERADRVPAFGEFGPFRAEGLACQWPAQGESGSLRKLPMRAANPPLPERFRLFGARQIGRFPPSHRRMASMRALFLVIDLALELYIWIVIAAAIFSWLVAFHVVNTRNQAIAMIGEFLYRITEPVLRPIRNFLPNLGGIDISPVVLFLIIIFIRYVIALYVLPNVY